MGGTTLHPGEAASLSLLVADDKVTLLGCNRQRVAVADDGFVLLGCEVNALEGDRGRYEEIARGVVAAMPGLWGYVGVDLMITDEGPMILEVNPRLTTSYVGLSRSLEANVAHMVLTLAGHGAPPVGASFPGRRVEVDLEMNHVA
ncbi:MAG: ATP-grasp domain-containing protein [Gammaproteobacteria bacterium]|nr:ATP-grasp domain-containing protein [Gammaproteobacteria bacterium]